MAFSSLASRVKMGKKVEKSLNKEKNPSATSQDDVDSNKALVENQTLICSESNLNEPHVCTGHFSADFSELCRRNNMTYIPPVVMRPRPPVPATQQDVSPTKGGKDKGKPSVSQPEPEPEETTEDGEPEPKTFTTKDKFEYFKPCVQVEMDNPDKPDTVTEVFVRGWKIDNVMMDMFTQCWQTMEKLHSINLWNTGLNSEGVSSLAAILPSCANLKNLTLDGNTAEEENWYELITEESPIQNISLRHCGITNKGAIMIGRCLASSKRTNVKLISLNLSNNKIGDEGMLEIAQGLRMNRTLLSMSLASNQIGDKGAIKLGEVLSRFPLTHEEVVERRRQMSDRGSPDRNKSPRVTTPLVKHKENKRKSISPPLSRRADSVNRPGSVRSNTHPDKGGKKMDKPSAKAKKDGKKDEKDDKHDKTKGKKEKEEKPVAKKVTLDTQGRREHLKVPAHGAGQSSPGHHDHARGHNSQGANVGGRSSGASLAADAKKGGKGGKGGKGTAKPQTAEHETSDSPEFINPLLEGADFIDGQLWVTGNRVLININLSRNNIGETGMSALLKAMQYQTTIGLDSKSNGTGLMRLLVGKNRLPASHDLMQKITDIMVPKDPFYKPPPQTPDVEA